MSKKKKIRVELRKNRTKPPRGNDITRQFEDDAGQAGDLHSGERVRAKGDISRHRTIVQDESSEGRPAAKADHQLVRGRVFKVHGLYSYIQLDSQEEIRCTIRRVLKSLSTDERNIVTTGDWVWVQPTPKVEGQVWEGTIEQVEPRHGVLTRASRRREHVLVANVDQVVIVVSLVEPDLKPHLIDRYIATAYRGELTPIVCLNKVDLADAVELQPLIGAYSQLGIPCILTSTKTGQGIEYLRDHLQNRSTVFSGQSGVGKSSLLNMVQPELGLRVKTVSETTSKGRHTTTTAELIKLEFGGWVVDTPGVRQLALWDTRPEEVEGYFPEFRPYVSLCSFPDCTHTHETKCAVKHALSRHQISERRYHSYLGLFHGREDE